MFYPRSYQVGEVLNVAVSDKIRSSFDSYKKLYGVLRIPKE